MQSQQRNMASDQAVNSRQPFLLIVTVSSSQYDRYTQALPAAPARTSEARRWLQGATTAAEQRNIELRTRSHLLSSVDPVPYGDTNGPTHAPAVVSIAPSPAAVPASSLGPWRIVRCIVARFIHYALLHANSGQPILVSRNWPNQSSSINPP